MSLGTKLLAVVEANEPAIIWSDPGMGKTFTAKRVAKHLEWHCHTEIASLHEPTDYSGVPFVSQDQIRIGMPDLINKLNQHEKVFLFLDELPTSIRATQNILLRLIHERMVGEFKLHDGVRIVAAGNFVDVAGNILLSTALANRFIHLYHKPTVQEWIDSDTESEPLNFKFNENWKDDIPQYKSAMFSFVESYPEYFSTVPQQIEKVEDYAFCSPRSLMTAAKILALTTNDQDLGKELCYGIIGAEPTKKLMTFLRSVDKIVPFTKLDINKFSFPDDPSQVMVLLKSAALYSSEKQYGQKATTLFKMAYDEGYKPLAMKYARLLAKGLVNHMPATEIVKAIPFVGEVLKMKS
jgi:hypothetical protein